MVHPSMEPFVLAAKEHPRPHPSTLTPVERRRLYLEQAGSLWPSPEPLAVVSDVRLALPGRELDARLYVPDVEEESALVVYFHGGSFVAGDLDSHDGLCRRLAADTKMRYLSVAYRLAPEHPFPAGLDDAREAIVFAASHRGEFAGAHSSLIVMGDSAGATLATVALNQLRGNVDVAAQVLLYPTLGPGLLTDSGHVYHSGFLLDVDHLRYDYGQYLGDFSDVTDERVSPLLASDLSGAPPAIIVVAECDPLRDEAVAYAGLLEHFGVRVELLEAYGMLHGFLRLGGIVPDALSIVDDLAEHLERVLAPAPSAPPAPPT
ncbi:MAG TPA: alpha/beta hydrolase [Acidimicrobiales bacterium]|nr:alpha/beta hydrolase [Acidimicrobiales bacterium]